MPEPVSFNVFSLMGTAWVVSGGLVAAVTGPADLEHGSWAAAYMVLVGGVAQGGLGTGQHLLTSHRPSRRTLSTELVGWNLGSVLVLAGTLLGAALVVDAGGLMLAGTLVLMVRTVLRGGASRASAPAWARWGFWFLVAVIGLSIPIGLVLAHLRA